LQKKLITKIPGKGTAFPGIFSIVSPQKDKKNLSCPFPKNRLPFGEKSGIMAIGKSFSYLKLCDFKAVWKERDP
jgi:hypothetical protein